MTESFRSFISAADSSENDVAVIAIPLFENDDIFKKIPEEEKIMAARSEHREPSSSTEKTETSTSFFFLPTLSTNRRDQHKVAPPPVEIVTEDAVSSLNIRYSTIQRGPQQDNSKTAQNISTATTTTTTISTTTISTTTTSTTIVSTTTTLSDVSDTISEESFMEVTKIFVSTTTESQQVDVIEEKEVIPLTTPGEDDITNTEATLTSPPAITKDDATEVTTKAIDAAEITTDNKERDEESKSDVNPKTDLNEVLTDQLRDAVKRGLTKEVDSYSESLHSMKCVDII